MGINRSIRLGLAGVIAALLCQPLSAEPADAAVTATSKTIEGSGHNEQEKVWFQRAFDTGERFFGKLRGNIRFVTETKATLSSTRTISSTDRGTMNAGGPISTRIENAAASSRLKVTARPTLQLIFEWQPQGDPYVCSNTTFPTFTGGDWFMRTDDGGPIGNGICGAFEVTADDISRILNQFGIDLELPEVFTLLDKTFTAGFGGTQTLSQSHQVFEVKVCKIATETFGIPLGDHCDLEVNAVVNAPLTTLGHTMEAQLCSEGTLNGQTIDCLIPVGNPRTLVFNGTSTSFSTKAPCPTSEQEIDVRLSDPAWDARLDDVTIGASLDFNVHITANGAGRDLITIPLPGSISLLDEPMALPVRYPEANNFVLHVGTVTPDDDDPLVLLNPSAVTIDEGSSTTFAPFMADLCTATEDLSVAWQIDGPKRVFAPTLTRTYANDLPNAVHNGSLFVTDEAGNQAPVVPFSVTVRNVPPSVQLSGFPTNPITRGTTLNLNTQVGDPGADLQTWHWSYGDGTNESRTATSVSDRADSRSHTYGTEGLYTLQVGVDDGTDLSSAGGVVTVFDPADKLVGNGTFTSDSSSINVPVGSSYSVQANVSYGSNAVRPSGPFVSDFLIDIGGNETVSKHLVATSYEWLFETALTSRVQGLATLSGESGWKFQAEVTRSRFGGGPQGSRITVSVWRPGVTTLANPDYRFGGPRDTGNIL